MPWESTSFSSTLDLRLQDMGIDTWSFDLGCLDWAAASFEHNQWCPWNERNKAESKKDLKAGGGRIRVTHLGSGFERKS